jgi:hypothetical protein
MPVLRPLAILGLLAASAAPVVGQDTTSIARVEFRVLPDSLDVGDSARVEARALAPDGREIQAAILFFSDQGKTVSVERTSGLLQAHRPGRARIFALVPVGNAPVRTFGTVVVRSPPLARITLNGSARLYAGTTVRFTAAALDAAGLAREGLAYQWSSSNRRVLEVNSRGEVTALRPGLAEVRAASGGLSGTLRVTVVANPARSLLLRASRDSARTGDVVRFTATALDAAGKPVPDYPIAYSVLSRVEDTVIAPEAPAQVEQDGRFVAARAGDYTVVATGGSLVARKTVAIAHRWTSLRLEQATGQGAVRDVHTSDLWVWTGKDGRDYAVTGTWGGSGVAYFWDVTDPANPVKTDSVQVDARTVNDVKVDPERELCFITREGASNRKNGFVILDCSNPRDVTVLSTFDDGLFGGVHNIFYWNRHVFPINAGTRFDIINVEDPRQPRRVGFYELDTPAHGIHDVWVVDGIAYSSNWEDGVVLIDVGNGIAGGSPSHPIRIGQYRYPIGATHSAFPYRSRTAGRFYVFVGDEQFPYGLDPDQPEEAGGYLHIVDFTDLRNPVEVARYQIPEAGPHNFWVENDTLYVAYYNAGLRVVDVSGELMGNLYTQGRELARFAARDPRGKVANAPMAWGPQPHKGHVFFSDFNSGLWAVKLPERVPRAEATP